MSRLDWLLGFAVFIVLVAVAVVGVFFWQQSRLDLAVTPVASGQGVPEDMPTMSDLSEGGEPALISFGRAHGRALNWQGDASLINASATWAVVNGATDIQDGRANWNFVFYSPTQNTAVSSTVVNDQVSVSEPYPILQKLNPLQVGGWRIDSDDALAIFLQNGGDTFLNTQTDITVTTQLSTISDEQRMEWLISAFANRNGEALTLVIDATSGEVLQTR